MTTLPDWPVVRIGDRDHPIRTLQYLLREQGYLIVQVDGIFGKVTDQAVRSYQMISKYKLIVDGVVGPKTWTALLVSVRIGFSGEAVAGVEAEIEYRNMSGEEHPIAGVFGKRVDEFIRGFQQACELEPDGIVGWMTWRCLIAGMYAG